jgi:hypothetical protein
MRRFAEAISWLWRLGPILDEPSPRAVGIGWHDEAAALDRLLGGGDLAGVAAFATRPGPDDGPVPSRSRAVGVADFGDGLRVAGQFALLHGGHPVVTSSLGAHASRDGNSIVFAADPEAGWGTLDGFWLWPALAAFIAEVRDSPLVMLPPMGLARYDDIPGTAYHQKIGKVKSDARARRRAEHTIDVFADAGAVLNVAISSRAFVDGREAPLDAVWPRAIQAFARGRERGVVEPICHGYLHLDAAALARGEIEPREFAHEGKGEAARKVDATLAWLRSTLGVRPETFVAPTWAYGPGLREVLAERELVAWLPPEPAPLLGGGSLRETLFSTLEGMFRLDYGPLRALAAAGLPPTVVVHGGLFDQRMSRLRADRDLGSAARLALRRDVHRLPAVDGIEWVGAAEWLRRLRAHGRIEVRDGDVHNPENADVTIVRGPRRSAPA